MLNALYCLAVFHDHSRPENGAVLLASHQDRLAPTARQIRTTRVNVRPRTAFCLRRRLQRESSPAAQ